jgi:phenylacetate-CoA ligase
MAFIRYRTGDFAEYVGNYCEECKRNLILIKNIQGRWDSNKIFLNDDSYVSITALNLHSDLYNFIEGLQYFQYEKGKLKINIVKGKLYDLRVENKFKAHFDRSLLGKCEYQIIYVQETIKEKNGKFLPLKQFYTPISVL